MGACEYETLSHGSTVGDAMFAAVGEAQWEHGHGGYTGTIAEKGDWVEFDLPPRVTAAKVLHLLYVATHPAAAAERQRYRAEYGFKATAASRKKDRTERRAWDGLVAIFGEREALRLLELFNDKWGPAVALPVRGKALADYKQRNGIKRMPRGGGVWLFCGYASC